jgi:UDP-N-acetylglucosamine 2-epimerase (non-hydrolysing)
MGRLKTREPDHKNRISRPTAIVHDMTRPLTILSVVGARPNFMKVAPIVTELRKSPTLFTSTVVHTGQHYDEKLSKIFFDDLGMPSPDVNLNIGSASHAQQTAAIMAAFEPVLTGRQADLVIVVGDVNSTIACALVAAKLGVPIAHVEAGLRSFDRTMPEEINRVLTDQISDLLFTTEPSAADNLRAEGISDDKIFFVGNVMIDTLLAHRERARAMHVPETMHLERREYGVLTLHRPSNVDDADTFERLVGALICIAAEIPIVFPVHPRTQKRLAASPSAARLIETGRLRLLDPLGYLEFIGLMDGARIILTDSGGVQEETTVLGIPCLTLRENTERPITVTHGTNRIVGTDPASIVAGWEQIKSGTVTPRTPPMWDGSTAQRIVEVIRTRLRIEPGKKSPGPESGPGVGETRDAKSVNIRS